MQYPPYGIARSKAAVKEPEKGIGASAFVNAPVLLIGLSQNRKYRISFWRRCCQSNQYAILRAAAHSHPTLKSENIFPARDDALYLPV